MNTKEKIAIMQAYVDGQTIQVRLRSDTSSGWAELKLLKGECDIEMSWDWSLFEYSIKPSKQLLIPWDIIKPEFKWAAMDGNGDVIVYAYKPQEYAEWWHEQCSFGHLSGLNIDTSDIDWKQSLTQRPE